MTAATVPMPDDHYNSRCPKCFAPVEQVRREYHALGECPRGNSGTEHVEWICICGYRWISYMSSR